MGRTSHVHPPGKSLVFLGVTGEIGRAANTPTLTRPLGAGCGAGSGGGGRRFLSHDPKFRRRAAKLGYLRRLVPPSFDMFLPSARKHSQ